VLADVALQCEHPDDGRDRIAGHDRPGYGGPSGAPTRPRIGLAADRFAAHHGPITSHARRATGRWLVVLLTAFATLPPASVAVAGSDSGPQITLMTRNVYLGSGLANLAGVSGPAELTTAVGEDWADVLATDFRTRATALAEEVAQARPDVIGLQEVTLWRDSPFSDLREHPGPNATHVVLDHLALLTSALAARGTPYTPVVTSTTDDFEVIRRDADRLTDLRITDRDVIMVRNDRLDRVSDPMSGHYTAVRVLPYWPSPVESPRGWTSIDYRLDRRTTVRILDTHLEVSGRRAGRVQERQADEVLAMVASSPSPVIALGDFNSDPGDPYADTYQRLTAVLHDAWTWARPADPGPTCCQDGLLDNLTPRLDRRVDLVLTSGDWPVTRVARTGVEPFRSGPAPVWASDHAGLTARLTVSG
jgi:endonuclease/exonuclease/phosphatase family metal-dependent hydrolase